MNRHSQVALLSQWPDKLHKITTRSNAATQCQDVDVFPFLYFANHVAVAEVVPHIGYQAEVIHLNAENTQQRRN
jgi:hypothetical protein